jgi:FAD/FMN-containing dehydrogenase
VRSIEVITADGRLLQVSAQSHPDLFWGLRGGGGNFGIATAIEFALYPVKEIFAGETVYPIEQGREVMTAYRQWVETLPETLTSMVRMVKYPSTPNVPPQLQGKTTIAVTGCYNGPESEGAALLQPMRTLGTPLLDTFALIPYSQVATITNDSSEMDPVEYCSSNRVWHDFTAKDSEALLEVVSNPASGVVKFEFRHLGGVVARIPEDEMAISLREINFFLFILAEAPTVEQLEAGKQSITKIMQAIPPDTEVHVEFNGLEFNDIGVERTRDAYTAQNYQRLVELKRTYDPQNVFHFNNNIPPTA